MADWEGAAACREDGRRHAGRFTTYCEKNKARPDLTTFLKFLTDKAF